MSTQRSKKTDAQIAQEVLDQLRWDVRVDPTEIGVEVHDGVVTLTGTVSSWDKKFAAEEAAHSVGGEREVAPATAGFVMLKSDRCVRGDDAAPAVLRRGGVRGVVNLIDVVPAQSRLRRSSVR